MRTSLARLESAISLFKALVAVVLRAFFGVILSLIILFVLTLIDDSLFQVLGCCSRSLDGLQTLLGSDLHAILLPGHLNATKIRDPAPFQIGATLILLD